MSKSILARNVVKVLGEVAAILPLVGVAKTVVKKVRGKPDRIEIRAKVRFREGVLAGRVYVVKALHATAEGETFDLEGEGVADEKGVARDKLERVWG